MFWFCKNEPWFVDEFNWEVNDRTVGFKFDLVVKSLVVAADLALVFVDAVLVAIPIVAAAVAEEDGGGAGFLAKSFIKSASNSLLALLVCLVSNELRETLFSLLSWIYFAKYSSVLIKKII